MTKGEVEASTGFTGRGVADWKITLEVDAGGVKEANQRILNKNSGVIR